VSTVLSATDITVRYGGVTALDAVTVEVPAGESVGLIGPNGAGKSTLLDVMTGFVQPVTGRIAFGDRDISKLSPWRRARLGLGRTFQATELFDDLSLRENLDVTGAQSDRIDELLAQLRLESYQDAFAGDMPAGVRRLASIARTLARRPRVVLLDEPGAGLMPAEKEQLSATLHELRAQHDLSLVLVDHDMSFIGRACSSIVVLDFGKVVVHGTPEEIRDDQRVREAYLGA
jgi:ABC-type branched-subunit amino acid transport system ATPase component